MDADKINEVREFNRFYTRTLQLTNKYHLGTGLTVLESRLLLEIYENKLQTANELVALLDIDKGYLSRVLKSLVKRGYIEQTIDNADKRSKLLTLTVLGHNTLNTINKRADQQVDQLFKGLSDQEINQVISAMDFIQNKVNLD
ncbi:MarR family winged helix-turn-helix transcriptional regulator [Companilactobacillus keshanensis]|uniref:MarR family winged helix-turn-helix transcriptional regulator n=1 Tax=Companilactobacillus keshanensis TaxID=2486003 RepID=A0ABW4BXW1_9LACO|nr:MarR family winged helix-turn-helix transcriptional regulator [Companilactobacillus keshanensis]